MIARTLFTVAGVCALGLALTVPGPAGLPGLPAAAQGLAASGKAGAAEERGAYDGKLDVLFVGAHPDDEAGGLSTYGQWRESAGISTGVVTVTRGEGGGNAVGLEEGAALGLLREAEERRAVGRAGITDVHNLDEVDFYYTVSQPLTRQIWDHDHNAETLGKLVRILRQTRPAVIVTMNPAPRPGNHGNHQEAARLAIEAYYAAADPARFPRQIRDEGLRPWQPARLFVSGAEGTGPTGPDCEARFTPADPSATVYGVWSGRTSAGNEGKRWAQIEREAQREYASQGWAGFPDVPSDPAALGCDRFTQVDARVPYPAAATAPEAMLYGAAVRAPGGLPLGTGFWLTTDRSEVQPGTPFEVTAHVERLRRPGRPTVSLDVPEGWRADRTSGTTFEVTPAAAAAPGTRARLTATLSEAGSSGTTSRVVVVGAPVRATPQLLPQVADYETWAAETGVPQLSGQVLPVLSLASGGSRSVRVDLANASASPQSGAVRLDLPEGFAADAPSKAYGPIPAGGRSAVTFTVTNTDPALPTSNAGGEGGDYRFSITTTGTGAPDARDAALELVPVTTIPEAEPAPTLDGVEQPGEYTGPELDLSRRWEGQACASAADCSATAKVTWSGDDLYLLIEVTDDVRGTVLDRADCKRHWRTDSVEIALDPRGTSENTSTTFKTGIFPAVTDNAGACFERDADNRQGPGARTAPGMRAVAKVRAPYTGYTVEAKVALADLPMAVDPNRLGLNLFVYDSDTSDKTGQTRIGWSTWGGVQGDPYRWGLATLPGYQPPADRPIEPAEPRVPTAAAASVGSPQSILQAASTGVPLAGGPQAPRRDSGGLLGPVRLSGGAVGTVRGKVAATGPGTAHVFVWKDGTLGSTTLEFESAGVQPFALPGKRGAVVAVAFAAASGGTNSSALPVR